ncbi:MAG: hypothetical protein LBK06_02655 [Planctomycetaceae bacterium]|jgi:hypothetical protein|nr:hypothetical protein [Planctomycetaceae bacterium]
MSEVKKIDYVLRGVIDAVRGFGITDEGPVGQQILLLGDTFYGYRFTGKEFTAVWSISDQMLNVFDKNGKRLGSSILVTPTGEVKLAEQSERAAA